MKKLLLIIAALVALTAFAAPKADKKIVVERPDMEQIRRDVSNPKSPYYYPKLMERYQQNETIMNLDDYRHLYLGMIFQEDFNPYRHNDVAKDNESLYFKNKHLRSELDTIRQRALAALDDNPFDLTQMNYLIFALRGLGKVNHANIWQYRLNHIIQAIISTGTGTDPENAWFVIDPRHEYNIVNFQNATAEKQEFVGPYFDHLVVRPRDGKEPVDYYFNIRNLLEEYNRKFPEDLD